MRTTYLSGFLLAISLIAMSCETIIDPTLEKAEPILVVDAWLTNQPNEQRIMITQTQTYFDNKTPPGVSSAVISVKNETDGRVFNFTPKAAAGNYSWTPSNSTEVLGKTGDEFSLAVTMGQDLFIASSIMGRVPAIDSISFTFEPASGFLPELTTAQFWATDLKGRGDAYWIKAWRNDTLLLKPGEINLAFDAGFSERGNLDGVTFIQPIRQGITPFDADDNGALIPPYEKGDSVYVEIHSLTVEAFDFLTEVVIQTDRPGGFSELFASPIANVSTNISNTNPAGKKAVGFFNVGAVSWNGRRLKE
jgi:Domain of unknown function (DUF4249)